LTNGSTTETSLYNTLGQRIQVSGGTAGTVLYTYDEAGHLLGEYDGTGTLIEETVWLGDIPVATLRPNGSTVAIDYVHTDQLNTPRQITRPSDNAQLWTWNSDPFGTDAANENPAGAGTFKYNLRFPGQIFDGQAGLHQNGFREYDPAVGRYVETDPLGLVDTTGTYNYVNADPLSLDDPAGLWSTDPATIEKAVARALRVEEAGGGPEDPWADLAAAIVTVGTIALADPPSDKQAAQGNGCPPGDDDKCKKAIADARREYGDLQIKRIPQYMYGIRHGMDEGSPGHYQAIGESQTALEKAMQRIRLYCKRIPAEMAKWERAVKPFPVRH
jgi:RHS repeat-associated protein